MPRPLPLIGVTALGGLLVLAVPAAAGGGWVLWQESGEICVDAIDAEWQAALDATDGSERHSFSRVTPTSALTMTRNASTNTTYIITYTCLPDSLRPPEPKGK